MGQSSKTEGPPRSASKPGKRKSAHFEKDSPKLSPHAKRSKNSNNGRTASPLQLASLGNHSPASISRGPTSVTSPAIDDAWRNAFTIENMNIISASSIQKKVTRAVDAIVGRTAPKQVVVELRAKAPVTSKMISVVEIAKRQIALKGEKWYQYSKVEQVLLERKAEGKNLQDSKKTKEKEDGPIEQDNKDEEDEEEEAFETMKTPFERANEGAIKVRAMPVMTIYLTHARIDELKKAYG